MIRAEASNGVILLTSDYDLRDRDRIKQVDGARFKAGQWSVPLTWASCMRLRGVFKDQLILEPGLIKWATSYKTSKVDPAMALRQSLGPSEDPLVVSWRGSTKDDLYGFQEAGVGFLATAETAYLCDDMGTGKTAQTISTLRYLEESGRNPYPAIIVAPTSLTTVWKNEFEKWYPAGVRISMIKGNITQRRAAIEAEADVYIINYESVRSHSRLAPYGSIKLQTCVECDNTVTDEKRTRNKCERCPKELNAIQWRTIIADEAHRLKDPKAKQTRAVWALNKPAAQYVYCLTGTAMTDAPHDLWGALHLMKPESFPSRGKFLDRYCDLAYNPFGGMTVKGLQDRHSEEFFSIVDPMLRRMPKDVVLPFLPQKTYVVRESPMVPAQKRQYDQLKKGMLAELKNGFMMVENMLTQATRLAQLACASMEETEDGEYRMVKPSGKINGLMDLLNDMGDKSLVVFSASRQLLELAKTALDEVKISWSDVVGGQTVDQRDKAVADFQAGRVRVILAMTGAGGEGLTMTRADTVCFLQRPWKMGQSKQAEDRVHRIGSEVHEKILVVDLITPDTVEAKIHRVLAEKGDRLEEVMRDQSFIESLLKDD